MARLDDYMAQVNQYDAGRPTTPTADKPGIKPVSRADVPAQRFDASQDAKTIARPPMQDTLGQGMGRSLMGAKPMQSYRGDAMVAQDEANTPRRVVGDIKLKQAQAESLAADPVRRMGVSSDKAMLVAAADTINRGNNRGPLPMAGETKELAPGPLAKPVQDAPKDGEGATPQGNSFTGNFAADNAKGQGIFKDPATGRVSIRLTGEEGGKFMNERIPTARPGVVLSATEAKGGKMPMGEYSGTYAGRGAMPVGDGPMAEQKAAEGALQRKQMEVMNTERADKSLLSGPGSRGYISPMLTEEQQRVRQNEVFAQQKTDMREARDNTIAQMETRDAALAARGIPSDATRNQSMAPYEARRTDINTRDAMLTRAQEQEKTGAAAADNAETRAADMEKAQIKDATDRYVADKNTELAQTNAQVAAQSKALDRETTLKAALIKADTTTDPVMVERVKGYNTAVANLYALGQEVTPEQLAAMRTNFGLDAIVADATAAARPTRPAVR